MTVTLTPISVIAAFAEADNTEGPALVHGESTEVASAAAPNPLETRAALPVSSTGEIPSAAFDEVLNGHVRHLVLRNDQPGDALDAANTVSDQHGQHSSYLDASGHEPSTIVLSDLSNVPSGDHTVGAESDPGATHALSQADIHSVAQTEPLSISFSSPVKTLTFLSNQTSNLANRVWTEVRNNPKKYGGHLIILTLEAVIGLLFFKASSRQTCNTPQEILSIQVSTHSTVNDIKSELDYFEQAVENMGELEQIQRELNVAKSRIKGLEDAQKSHWEDTIKQIRNCIQGPDRTELGQSNFTMSAHCQRISRILDPSLAESVPIEARTLRLERVSHADSATDPNSSQKPVLISLWNFATLISALCIVWVLYSALNSLNRSLKRNRSFKRNEDKRAFLESLHAQSQEVSRLYPMESATVVKADGRSTAVPIPIAPKLRSRKRSVWASAFKGDAEAVQAYLADSQSPGIDTVDDKFGTLIAAAAQGGRSGIVEMLLRRKADVTKVCGKYGTPLHAAAYSGDVSTINLLCADGNVKINQVENTNTPLSITIEQGHEAAFFRLIDYGAALSVFGMSESPLHIATRKGHTTICLALINQGAEVNLCAEANKTPLHLAAQSNRHKIAEKLLAANANLNARDSTWQTALHYAAISGSEKATKVLLDHGASVSVPDIFNTQPLFRAAEAGFKRIVKMLLEHCADVNARNSMGQTALHVAEAWEDIDIPKMLLEHGAEVDAPGFEMRTPLHQHISSGNFLSVKYLLQQGANPLMEDADQATPLHYAVKSGKNEVKREYGASRKSSNMDAITNETSRAEDVAVDDCPTVITRQYEKIAILLINRMHSGIEGRDGNTLQEAIVRGSFRVVREMLSKNPGMIDCRGGEHGSAIGAAVIGGDPDMVQLLLQYDADPNTLGGEFGTPLQAAAWKGNVKLVNLLINRGADARVRAGRFGTALHAAIEGFHEAEQLRQNNPTPETTAEWNRRKLIKETIQSKCGSEYKDVGPPSEHRYERWELTPNGWGWLPRSKYLKARESNESEHDNLAN